jgi:two-component system phosphate regulon sensor histidine kinase PhoR
MITIVNDLLHVDSTFNDESPFEFKKKDLTKLIEQVVDEFSNQSEGKNIKITIQKPNKSFSDVELDDERIKIVFENLIDNAITYTPAGGKVDIVISDDKYNLAHNKAEVIISDTGIGIPSAEKTKVFEQFFRASNGVLTEPDGTGVGLYVSKDIVEKHGGSLWFENREEGGTSFHVALPFTQDKK